MRAGKRLRTLQSLRLVSMVAFLCRNSNVSVAIGQTITEMAYLPSAHAHSKLYIVVTG